MPGPDELANLKIIVGADVEAAKAGIQGVKADIESVGPSSDAASAQTQEAISRVVSRLDDIISILDGVEEKTRDVTEFSKRAWGSAAESVNPYISAVENLEDVTESVKSKTEKTGATMGGAFARAGDQIDGATSGVRKFIGSLTSVTGIATGLIGIFGLLSGAVLGFKAVLDKLGGDGSTDAPLPKVGELLDELAKKARGVDEALQNSPGYVSMLQRIEDTKKELSALNAELARSLTPRGVGPGERSVALGRQESDIRRDIKEIQEEIVRLDQQSNDILESANRKREEAARQERESLELAKKQSEALKSIRDVLSQQGISLLQDDEQLEAQAERQKQIIENLYRGFAPDELVDEAIENIDRITQKQNDAERERQRIADEAQRARDAESAARLISSAEQAAEAFSRGLDGIFGADFTTRLDNLTAAVRDGNNAIRRLK